MTSDLCTTCACNARCNKLCLATTVGHLALLEIGAGIPMTGRMLHCATLTGFAREPELGQWLPRFCGLSQFHSMYVIQQYTFAKQDMHLLGACNQFNGLEHRELIAS